MVLSIWWSLAVITAKLTEIQSATVTVPLTPGPGCSANNAFIYVESSLGSIAGNTITSERVNYAPYTYTGTVPRRKIVSFAADEPMTESINNPCVMSTWTVPRSYYSDAIVLMEYNLHFITLCTPQKWSLNLQNYTNVQALLIANNADLTYVYPLHGDESLPDPYIPTRMISQSGAANIWRVLNTTEEVYASIGCFDVSIASIICVADTSNIGSNVELDGDFQQQGGILVNDHPVWQKEGMNRVWDDYYIWLSVDTSLLINSWKWVIGTNFNDESSIIAECLLNTIESIDDPTKCGHNWYRNGDKISNLTSTDGVCDLGDSYVCANSGSTFFDYYFGGRYRQVHDGTAVWLSDSTTFEAYISVQYVNRSFAHGWSFVFSYAANGGTYAFCPISETQPSADMMLKPWDCNKNWYVVTEDDNGGWVWFNDPLMDVDECSHPDAPVQEVTETINYPETLCFMDPTYKYSQYQIYYGVYTLNDSLTYGGRHVYRNERLQSSDHEWFMIWYEEKDAWIINEHKVSLPSDLYASAFGGICRDNVDTPDECTSCWEFVQGVEDEMNCDAKVNTMITSTESDCMTLPINNIVQYADDVMLCFNDGSDDVLQSPYTGKWKLESRGSYNGRAYWYKTTSVMEPAQYYMYYDETWRYWVIDAIITPDEDSFELFCLHWDEFEPFNCDTWYTRDGLSVSMDTDCTLQPTASPTPHPTTECIEYNKYVHAASPAFTHQILTSAEVNFPPYSSSTFYDIAMVPFEALTLNTGNPCNSTTWTLSPSYYNNTVVLIKYSSFYESLCTPQQWTLELEHYANVEGVIVSNDADLTHVYSLPGDHELDAPTIPTRMLSQMAGHLLEYAIQRQDPVYISFGCFDDTVTVPSTICLVDTTIVGEHVYLDGEYQRQAIEVNDHPVWLKQGHIGLWGNIYMFLDVDRNQKGYPSWRWVIATDYTDRSSIIAECNLNGQHIAHPALCDHDWSVNGTLESNITTQGTQCSLGDKYVCVESANGGFFESYFEGRYRQVHEGVPLWLLENEYLDAHIRIARLSWPAILGPNTQYVFAFMVNQSNIYAFCVIGEGYPTYTEALSPWQCNDDWYVISWSGGSGYQWVIDLAFDVDECTHPNITTTMQPIDYPEMICLSDPTNAHSHYQSRYGVWLLDTNTIFDGRYVYRNQRLMGTTDESYMLWYEEKDAWVINEMVPGLTVVRDTDGICREDVSTPDLCNACWEFANIHGIFGENCFAKATVASSDMESNCMNIPSNSIIHPTHEISLCFDDGVTADWDNAYSGDWILEADTTYNDRAYWYKLDSDGYKQYYIFYDSVWRYWVLDRVLGSTEDTTWYYLHWYCLNWDEFEPFNCDTWYSALPNIDYTLSMTRDCVSSAPTTPPTLTPTVSCDARETWIYAESENYVLIEETLISQYANFAPYVYDTFDDTSLVLFEDGRNMSEHSSNPCDYYTWIEYPIYYENNVVMIYLSKFIASLCSVELWTYNLETYAHAKAVVVVNDADLYHVYALPGDAGVSNPSIPTRMISQFAGDSIQQLLDQRENVLVTFGCFDDLTYPPIICLVDTSIMGTHVYLDGEYQRQNIDMNEHPVWLKAGYDGLWKNVYMFLDIDPSVSGASSWQWVIATDYDDRESIIAECRLDEDIDHPALCDGYWYIDDSLASNVITSDTTCALGDNYVCVTSASGRLFDYYFDGQYRQIHDGVPLWLLEDSSLDAYITVGQMTLPPLFDNEYIFAFVLNQSEIYAFCPIGSEVPSLEESLSPWKCNEDWYKIEFDANNAYEWVVDYEFDIDECLHHDLTTEPPQYVSYPDVLCLNDATDAVSRYQSHYGVYVLDTSRTYDDKYVYYNQRLAGNHDEWFMIWYEEKDAWVINEMIPEETVVHDNDGICRDEVFTPDLCHACWEFADIHGVFETNCNVKVSKMLDTNEDECMSLPVNDNIFPEDYTAQITLGFGDDKASMHMNEFTGIWRLDTNHQYLDRAYWYKSAASSVTDIDYYMFYDPTWRYWVIDRVLGNTVNNEWHLYCVEWYSFEPFKCEQWSSSSGLEVSMDTNYTMPTSTSIPLGPGTDTSISNRSNLLPYIGWSFGFVAMATSLICLVCFIRKKKEKHYMFVDVSKDGSFKTIYGVSRNNDKDDIDDLIQMEQVEYGGTLGSATGKGTKGRGEMVAVHDSDSDENIVMNPFTVTTGIIDDGEGLVTGDDETPLNERISNRPRAHSWVKF